MDPARYTGPIHFLLGRGARRVRKPELDASEDIEVVTLPLSEAIALALDGGILHASHVAGLMIAAKRQGWISGEGEQQDVR
jgi:hypothetical protein